MGDLDELPQQLAELRELIRQAHEASQDLRQAVRDARELRDELPGRVKDVVAHTIGNEVNEGLQTYRDALAEAIASSTEKVYERFDKMAAILLGEDPKSLRAGNRSLPEMLANIAARAGTPVTLPMPGGEIPPGFRKRDGR